MSKSPNIITIEQFLGNATDIIACVLEGEDFWFQTEILGMSTTVRMSADFKKCAAYGREYNPVKKPSQELVIGQSLIDKHRKAAKESITDIINSADDVNSITYEDSMVYLAVDNVIPPKPLS